MTVTWENILGVADDLFNTTRTENGAIGYSTAGSALVDLNFKTSSYRNDKSSLFSDFRKAFSEDPVLALKWLFFARDIRGGMGERDLFRYIITNIAHTSPDLVDVLIDIIPEYGRWDDLFCLFGTPVEDKVLNVIKNQLQEDIRAAMNNESVSLLAKWLPSVKATNDDKRELARKIRCALGISEKVYRKTLSKLRRATNVVEIDMSENKWESIVYENVPSRANLNYANAFQRHDKVRYNEFILKVSNGEAKMNASTLYPSDIVHKYLADYSIWNHSCLFFDDKYEALWKNLKDVEGLEDTIVVCDTSGSMGQCAGNSDVTAEEIARSLAIYFSERLHGEFKDKIIAFSRRPFLIDLSDRPTLYSKLTEIEECCIVDDTNIKAVFDLILQTAIKTKSVDIPKTILIISDMEFNQGTTNMPLIKEIEEEYNKAGYSLPKLVFWNILSRTNAVPLKKNDKGVILISGFSPSVMDMVLSGETDPYKALVSVLNKPRYDVIEKIIKETKLCTK